MFIPGGGGLISLKKIQILKRFASVGRGEDRFSQVSEQIPMNWHKMDNFFVVLEFFVKIWPSTC